ncbi:MAG: hypothetical protein JXX28_17890, partial [Deltaproteobacteria bacterium]|nr:hypothetical protein [Deltaproteobacteria bacterium]
WVVLPRPPGLDEERWFKLMLATLLRGRVERDGGDVAAWEAAVLRFVPYHPAGRLPEEKALAPSTWSPPGPSLPGEVALLEALGRCADLPCRWARMYDQDTLGLEARLQDPLELGAAYRPDRWLGPGASWDDIAGWGAGEGPAARAIAGALPARWLLVPGTGVGPALLDVLARELGEGATKVERAALPAVLEGVRPGERLVLVGEGEGIQGVLHALKADVGARDALAAVVSLGGVIRGWPEGQGALAEGAVGDWLGAHFTQEGMDLEALRAVPWISLQWLDRGARVPGAGGLPLQAMRFPEPAPEPGGRRWVDPVDLGPLPVDPELPLELVARALIALTACASKARGG